MTDAPPPFRRKAVPCGPHGDYGHTAPRGATPLSRHAAARRAGRDRGRSGGRAERDRHRGRAAASCETATKPAQLDRIKALRILIQSNGAALLLDGHAELVGPRRGRRRAPDRNRRAARPRLPALKPKYIAGLRRARDAPRRHAGWRIGRRLRHVRRAGRPAGPAFDAVLERVAWWAEIFQIPCVGYAASVDEVEGARTRGRRFRRDRRSHLARSGAASRRRSSASCRGARAMKLRGLLILSAAIGVLAGAGDLRAQPMQISPPVARPPASIPAKPAESRRQTSRRPPAKQRPRLKKSDRRAGRQPAARRPRRRRPRSRRKTRWCSSRSSTPEKPAAPTRDHKTTALQPQAAPARKATSPTAPISAATISRHSGRRRAAPANRAIRSP